MVSGCSDDNSETESGPRDPFNSEAGVETVLVDGAPKQFVNHKLDSEQLESELNLIIVDNVFIEDEEFDIALDWVIQKGSELSSFAPYILPYKLAGVPPVGTLVSIDKKSIRFDELLDELSKEANIAWQVDEGVIVFTSTARAKKLGGKATFLDSSKKSDVEGDSGESPPGATEGSSDKK